MSSGFPAGDWEFLGRGCLMDLNTEKFESALAILRQNLREWNWPSQARRPVMA